MLSTKMDTFALLIICHTILKAVSRSCNYHLSASNGVITTPNYPGLYPNSVTCIWKIIAPPGYYVELTFHDFDIEPYQDCKTDVLEIKDGPSRRSPLVGPQYCNTRNPPPVLTSSRNHLRLWFSSDSTYQFRGFNASYRVIYEKACGGEISATHGVIESPRFPLNYPGQRKCEWKINVPKGKHVALKFVTFEVEYQCQVGSPCRCLDFVHIKDGHQNNAKDLGKHCFTAPPPLVTSGNQLLVSFSSDKYGRLQGFKAVFTQSATKHCGGDVFTGNGTIESPLFDISGWTTYPDYSDCVWVINSKRNENISIHFEYMDVLASFDKSCSEDYIEIRDGPHQYSPLKGYYCNAFNPGELVSSGNAMFIRFHSNEFGTGKGFRIRFHTNRKSCYSPLGMENHRIADMNVFATSYLVLDKQPFKLQGHYGRLNGMYAWCSQKQRFDFVGEYMQINLNDLHKITGVAIQGYQMNGHEYYVKQYKIQYQVSGGQYEFYKSIADAAAGKSYTILDGNNSHNSTQEIKLSPEIVLKKLRIVPLSFHSGWSKHICMRVEVYGCKLAESLDDIKVLSNTRGSVYYGTRDKSNVTWVVAAPRAGTNSVLLLHVTRLQADCSRASFIVSYFHHFAQSTRIYCRKSNPNVVILPTGIQMWLRFSITATSSRYQSVQFNYKVENLGFGRLVREAEGIIEGTYKKLARQNVTSIWLLKLPAGKGIDLEFQNIHLPKRKNSPYIVVKAGLLESSPTILQLQGTYKSKPLVYFSSNLRIEYHPNLKGGHNEKYDSEGFTLHFSVWMNATSRGSTKK